MASLAELEEIVRARIQSVHHLPTPPKKVAPEIMWGAWLLTRRGKDPLPSEGDCGVTAFYSNPWEDNPWAESVSPQKLSKSKTRVVICTTNVGFGNLGFKKIRRGEKGEGFIPDIVRAACDRNGVVEPDIHFSRDIEYFWGHFYGTKEFLSGTAGRPALVLTTGVMRCYLGGGSYRNVEDRLRKLCEVYSVPFELLPDIQQ